MSNQLIAQQVIDRIKNNLGVPWRTPTADGFSAGSPDSAIDGIATTFTPTLDVLRRAVAAGRNMIVSREPAFWSRNPPALLHDPTYLFKQEFIASHHLVIWRFRDNWQARAIDGQRRALALALGWDKHPDQEFFALPTASLQALVKNIQARLKICGMRVIGDPRMQVSKVALSHGMITVPEMQRLLREPSLDVVVIGEPVEWEASPYFLDVIASGRKKALIVLGQEASEEPGSRAMADWLKSFISEVPVEYMPAGEPFSPWRRA